MPSPPRTSAGTGLPDRPLPLFKEGLTAAGALPTLVHGSLASCAGRGRRVGESAPVPRAGLRQARSEGLASARPSSFTSRIRLPTFLGWAPPRLRGRGKAKAALHLVTTSLGINERFERVLAVGCWNPRVRRQWPAEDGDANPRGKGGGPGEQALLPGCTEPGPGDRSGFASPSSARAKLERTTAVRRTLPLAIRSPRRCRSPAARCR